MLEFKRAFKEKTIDQAIKHKMNRWLKSLQIKDNDDNVTNKDFIEEVRDHIIVTGGAIASMLMGYMPNDYDIYFSTKEVATKVALHYIAKLPKPKNGLTRVPEIRENDNGISIYVKSAGIAGEDIDQTKYEYFEYQPAGSADKYLSGINNGEKKKETYKVSSMTTNAISLTDNIQLIIRFIGEPNVIHTNYDFVHCTNYWTFETGVVTNKDAILSIINRELRYVGSKYPVASLFRLRKFINRGFTIFQSLNLTHIKQCMSNALVLTLRTFKKCLAS